MEKVLQSLVKIIIIASVFDRTTVLCNRQFLPLPPLPYYHNDDYYTPDYSLSYQDPGPVFYSKENLKPPHAFMDYYSPPQLFHQNRNYHPPQELKPIKNYPYSQVLPFEANYHPVIPPSLAPKISTQMHQIPKIPPAPESPKFPPSRIIYKVETAQPYYQDDYIKNYHDDDYSDNYNDDISVQPEPCTPNTPYRYFKTINKSSGPDRNHSDDNYYPCKYPSNFYGLKAPLTLLPSRFPPRVEQLIERIQNYFSTYTEQETKKPENSTSQPSSTTEILSVSPQDTSKKNTTEPNQPTEPTNTATIPVANNVIQITEETEEESNSSKEVNNELPSSLETGVENQNKSQVDAQYTATSGVITDNVPATTESVSNNETFVNEKYETVMKPQQSYPTEVSVNNENSKEEQTTNELDQLVERTTVTSIASEFETKVMSTEVMDFTTELTKNEHEEEYTSISTTNEIYHKVTDNNGFNILGELQPA